MLRTVPPTVVSPGDVLHAEPSTLVIGTNFAANSQKPPTDGKVALRMTLEPKQGSRRFQMEVLTCQIPGVVRTYYLQNCKGGVDFGKIFSDRKVFFDKIAQQPLIRHVALCALKKMEKKTANVVLSWSEKMDGDLAEISVRKRASMGKQLTDLFVSVLKTGALKKYGAYILHNDLQMRNVLFRRKAAKQEGLELALTDFEASCFTHDEAAVDYEIASAVERMTSKPMYVKRSAAQAEVFSRGGVSKRRRLSPRNE